MKDIEEWGEGAKAALTRAAEGTEKPQDEPEAKEDVEVGGQAPEAAAPASAPAAAPPEEPFHRRLGPPAGTGGRRWMTRPAAMIATVIVVGTAFALLHRPAPGAATGGVPCQVNGVTVMAVSSTDCEAITNARAASSAPKDTSASTATQGTAATSVTTPATPAPARTTASTPPPVQTAATTQAAGTTPATTPAAATQVDWGAVEATAAADVFRVESYSCLPGTLTACTLAFQGTGYFAAMPGWACTGSSCTIVSSNPTPAPVLAISAYHMACDPLLTDWISRMSWLDSQGHAIFTRTATTRTGLCNEQDEVAGTTLGDPTADVGAWAADVWRGIPVATQMPAVGDTVAILGNPGGESTGQPIATTGQVLGTDVTFKEASEYGLPTRTISGAIELAIDAFPGDSGAPVINAEGQVVGTLVAGGPQTQGNGTAQLTAYVLPIDTGIPWLSWNVQ